MKNRLLCLIAGIGLASSIVAPVVVKELKNIIPKYDNKVIPILNFNNFLQGGAALKIINNSIQKISYWYTSIDNNQNRKYQHTIGGGNSTWDWMWANYSSTYPLEIFIIGLNNYNYFLLFGFLSNNWNNHYFSLNIAKYPKNPSEGVPNPKFNNYIWYNLEFYSYRWADSSSHSTLTINNFGNDWIILNNIHINS